MAFSLLEFDTDLFSILSCTHICIRCVLQKMGSPRNSAVVYMYIGINATLKNVCMENNLERS